MVSRKKSTKRAAAVQKAAPSARKTPLKTGRPAFKPTKEQVYSVGLMASIGIPQDQIAMAIGVDKKTLQLHFRKELDVGSTQMLTRVADSLFRQALAGNVSACIFIMKCRAGWSEHAGRDAPGDRLGKKDQLIVDAQNPPAGSKWEGLLQ